MSPLPAVVLDLSDYVHPHCDQEWTYGPRRVGGLGDSYPVVASADPAPGEPMVAFNGPLGLDRDRVPHLISWLTAVYVASDPARSPVTGGES